MNVNKKSIETQNYNAEFQRINFNYHFHMFQLVLICHQMVLHDSAYGRGEY